CRGAIIGIAIAGADGWLDGGNGAREPLGSPGEPPLGAEEAFVESGIGVAKGHLPDEVQPGGEGTHLEVEFEGVAAHERIGFVEWDIFEMSAAPASPDAHDLTGLHRGARRELVAVLEIR